MLYIEPCTYIYICIVHTCVYIYTHTYVSVYLHAYIYIYTCMWIQNTYEQLESIMPSQKPTCTCTYVVLGATKPTPVKDYRVSAGNHAGVAFTRGCLGLSMPDTIFMRASIYSRPLQNYSSQPHLEIEQALKPARSTSPRLCPTAPGCLGLTQQVSAWALSHLQGRCSIESHREDHIPASTLLDHTNS